MKKIPVFSKIFLISKSFFILPVFFPGLVFFAVPCGAVPGVSIKTDGNRMTAGTPFVLALEVFWQGTADDYIIVPPSPVFPENLAKVSAAFSSVAAENSYSLVYKYTLKPAEAGEYTISPIEIKYWAGGEDRESLVMSDAVTFSVSAARVFSLPLPLVLGLAGLLLVLTAGLFFVFFRDRRLARRGGQKKSETRFQAEIRQALDRCKKCRTEGDTAGFYREAITVLSGTGEAKEILAKLEKGYERVTFGSYQPTAAETEAVLRRVTRAAAKTAPAQEASDAELQKYCK